MPQGLTSFSSCTKNGEQHVCDLRRFLERLIRINLKLAPNKALLGAAEIIFLEHKISLEGVGPDPGKAKAMKEMSMSQDTSQLRLLLGALSYYRQQNLPSLSDKSNRAQRWFDLPNACTFTLKHRSKNINANAGVLSRLPLPATALDLRPRYRLTASSDLDVYFVCASGIHLSRFRTPSDSNLGGLTNAAGGLANALGGRAATPDYDVFVGRRRE